MYSRLTGTPQHHLKQAFLTLAESDDDNDDDEIPYGGEDTPILDLVGSGSFSVLELKAILLRALTWYFVHRVLSDLSNTATVNIYAIPFIFSMASKLFDDLSSEVFKDQSIHEQRLDDVLRSWKLVKISQSTQSQACIFSTVAHNLKFQLEEGNSILHQLLLNVGISASMTTSQIIGQLKELVAAVCGRKFRRIPRIPNTCSTGATSSFIAAR